MTDLQKWLTLIRDMELLPTIMGGNFSNLYLQIFDGNVTIFPPFPRISQLLNLLSNPTEESYGESLRNGQLYTWPVLKMVENQAKIEHAVTEWYTRCKMQLN